MIAPLKVRDRRGNGKPLLRTPFAEKTQFILRFRPQRVIHPLIRCAARKNYACEMLSVFLLNMHENIFHIFRGDLPPIPGGKGSGDLREAVGSFLPALQFPHEPRRRIQIEHEEKLRIRTDCQNVFKLAVECGKIVLMFPEPDRRIFRIGLSESIDRIGGKNAELPHAESGKYLPCFQFLAERAVGKPGFRGCFSHERLPCRT